MSNDEPRPLDSQRAPHAGTEASFRLSLATLLLWMAATALALMLLRPTFDVVGTPDWEAPQRQRGVASTLEGPNGEAALGGGEPLSEPPIRKPTGPIARALVATVAAPFYGAAILALGTAIWMTVRGIGPLDVREPGHWLLLIVGTAFLGVTVLGWLEHGRPPDVMELSLRDGALLISGLFLSGCALLLAIWACFEVTEPPAWKVAFRLLAVCGLTCGCGCPPLLLMLLLLLFAAATGDVASGQYRDLAHWVGVITVFVGALHLVALAALGR